MVLYKKTNALLSDKNSANMDATVLYSHLPFYLQHIIIDCVGETGSTNDDLLDIVKDILPNAVAQPILRQAARQIAGRGRLGRRWFGCNNAALTFSLAWPFMLPINKMHGLSLICGMALIQALTADIDIEQAQRLKLKWPNDILLDNRKLAGILVETVNIQPNNCWAVIGIGINYRYDRELEKRLGRKLAGLDFLREDLDLVTLLARCIVVLARQLRLFEAKGFYPFYLDWSSYDAYAEKLVDIYDGSNHIAHGIAKGIDEMGRLLLQTHQGLLTYIAGEVSLRRSRI